MAMSQPINPLRKYIREGKLPHFFCPGCGCGQILNAFLQACDELSVDPSRMVIIGGVGCTARIPVYLKGDVLHGVHGRTLAWATGIKLHKPQTKVVIFAGDGDVASIGGNHLIHAARRNLDVLVVVANNFNYAMTGGQVAPMTPSQVRTMTTPFGNPEPSFDICELVVTAGATYVAREATGRPVQLERTLKKALTHEGFALVEVLSQCPTNYGRYALRSGDPAVTLKWIMDRCITKAQADKLSKEEKAGKFVLGEFVDFKRPIFCGSSVYDLESCECCE